MASCPPEEAGYTMVDSRRASRLLRRFAGYLRPYWVQLACAIACVTASAAIGLVPAFVIKSLVDALTASRRASVGHVAALVAVGIGAAVASALLAILQSYLSATIGQGVKSRLRVELFDALLGQSVGFFTRTRVGETVSRLVSDIDAIDTAVTWTLVNGAANVVTALATVAFMFALDWRLTLLALVMVPVTMVPSRRAARVNYGARKRTQDKKAQLTGLLQEVLGISGIVLVKSFASAAYERHRFRRLAEDLRGLEIRQQMVVQQLASLMNVISSLAPMLFWLVGGVLVVTGHASLGTAVTFVTVLIGRFGASITGLGSLHVNAMGALSIFERLLAYLDMPPEVPEPADGRTLHRVRGAIRFEDVSFAYGPGLAPALDGVDVAIEPGQLVALVGPSGAGKTTLTHLLCRFSDPQRGAITIDGVDLRSVTLESLNRQVGVVFQDTFLFHASIADNLRYARPDASRADLEAAVEAACLADLVASLPDGLDTLVGERGFRLSGGEKQRLAIARVLLKDSPVLVFDEATSNLDSVSERLVQTAMRRLLAGRTALVIAHRLSTVQAADMILVLDRGRLVERGRHDELLRAGDVYARLYEEQFRPAEATPAAS